jgi:hypothetical protein
MKKFIVTIAYFGLLFSCNPPKNKTENYNIQLSDLVFSNQILKNNFEKMFNLKDSINNIFKVLISRRDHFVRVTIYQLINKEEIKEYPSSYFVYQSRIFLCYDGSEAVYNKKVDSLFMNKLKMKMTSGAFNDSRVFQFDINENKNISLHVPAINPYDFDFSNKTNTVHFPRYLNIHNLARKCEHGKS